MKKAEIQQVQTILFKAIKFNSMSILALNKIETLAMLALVTV